MSFFQLSAFLNIWSQNRPENIYQDHAVSIIISVFNSATNLYFELILYILPFLNTLIFGDLSLTHYCIDFGGFPAKEADLGFAGQNISPLLSHILRNLLLLLISLFKGGSQKALVLQNGYFPGFATATFPTSSDKNGTSHTIKIHAFLNHLCCMYQNHFLTKWTSIFVFSHDATSISFVLKSKSSKLNIFAYQSRFLCCLHSLHVSSMKSNVSLSHFCYHFQRPGEMQLIY